METVKQLCVPRPSTFDASLRDTVLHLGDLVANRIDAPQFFAENYITEGMATLLTESFRPCQVRRLLGTRRSSFVPPCRSR